MALKLLSNNHKNGSPQTTIETLLPDTKSDWEAQKP